MVGVVEMGAAIKNAAQRAKSGPLAQRISKRVEKFRYRVAPGPVKQLDALATAFNVVADTRYAGPSALANRATERSTRCLSHPKQFERKKRREYSRRFSYLLFELDCLVVCHYWVLFTLWLSVHATVAVATSSCRVVSQEWRNCH